MNWDDPGSWPAGGSWPAPGGSIEGTVTRIAILPRSAFGKTEERLCVELDGDGVQRWCNNRLWRTVGEARIVPGDRVRITRGPDQPNPTGARPITSWTVERLQQAPPAPAASGWGAAQAPVQQAGPSW